MHDIITFKGSLCLVIILSHGVKTGRSIKHVPPAGVGGDEREGLARLSDHDPRNVQPHQWTTHLVTPIYQRQIKLCDVFLNIGPFFIDRSFRWDRSYALTSIP